MLTISFAVLLTKCSTLINYFLSVDQFKVGKNLWQSTTVNGQWQLTTVEAADKGANINLYWIRYNWIWEDNFSMANRQLRERVAWKEDWIWVTILVPTKLAHAMVNILTYLHTHFSLWGHTIRDTSIPFESHQVLPHSKHNHTHTGHRDILLLTSYRTVTMT